MKNMDAITLHPLYLLSMYTQSSSCIDDRCTLFSNLPYYSAFKRLYKSNRPLKARGQGDRIKTQSYLLKKTNISHCPDAAVLHIKRARVAVGSVTQLELEHCCYYYGAFVFGQP